MGIAAGTALMIMAATSAATTVYSVREQNMASKRASTIAGQQADAQAKQLQMQAQSEKTGAALAELERQRTLDRIISAQNAVFGASGLSTSSGSFASIQTADASRASEASRLNQLFEDTRQLGFQSSIQGIYNQAAINRGANKISRRTNTLRGATSILNIGANAYAGKQ